MIDESNPDMGAKPENFRFVGKSKMFTFGNPMIVLISFSLSRQVQTEKFANGYEAKLTGKVI
jgi:hypothetical protein